MSLPKVYIIGNEIYRCIMTKVNGMSLENYIWNRYKDRVKTFYQSYGICSFFTKNISDLETMTCATCKYYDDKDICPKLK